MKLHGTLLGIISSGLLAGSASAEIEYEIHAGYSSLYLWRGTDRGDHLMEAGIDLATNYNDINLAAGVWSGTHRANTDLFPGTAGDTVNNEINFFGRVSKDFGIATLGVGYVYYWQTGNLGIDYQEVFFTVSRDFGFAEAYLRFFWDVEGVDGLYTDGYTELGLERSWDLVDGLSLRTNTHFGYFADESTFGSWSTRLALDWQFAENATLSPFAALAVDLADTPGLDDELAAGLMLSVNF